MKRLTAITAAVVFAFCMASHGLAQEGQKNKSVGIRGGLNFATLGGDVTQVDSKLGFAVGVFGGYRFSELWGLQAILSYSQKGGKDTGLNVAASRTFSFPYIELQLPLVLTPRIDLGSVDLRLYGGPYAAFSIGCNVKVESGGETTNSSCENAPPEVGAPTITDLDYGLVVGIGLDLIGRGASGLSLDVAYDFGLANINDIADGGSIENRTIQLLIGYVHAF